MMWQIDDKYVQLAEDLDSLRFVLGHLDDVVLNLKDFDFELADKLAETIPKIKNIAEVVEDLKNDYQQLCQIMEGNNGSISPKD